MPAGITSELPRPYVVETINPNGTTSELTGVSASQDTFLIAKDLGAGPYPEDKISVFPDLKMDIGGKVTLKRAPSFTLHDGKKTLILRSWQGTVGELLIEKNVELGTDDKINFATDMTLENGMEITITRVSITNVIEKQSIAFQILEKEDPNLDYGKKRVESGVQGEKKLTYRVRREDGEEVERKLISTEITNQPKSQINYTGTKVTVLSSVRGKATIGPKNCNIVSANYKRGTLVRITNQANGVKLFGTVDCTWGTATAPDGIVLDVSMGVMGSLKWNGSGAGPSVLVEEIKQ